MKFDKVNMTKVLLSKKDSSCEVSMKTEFSVLRELDNRLPSMVVPMV